MKILESREREMREEKVPWFNNLSDLTKYIESLVKIKHDYGTGVYAMSMAATATFYYMSNKIGCTGFQSSCADLDIIRRTRSMDCPFMIIKAEDMLYPQSDIHEKLNEALNNWKSWAKEEAKKKIENTKHEVHPAVMAHWKKLAEEK